MTQEVYSHFRLLRPASGSKRFVPYFSIFWIFPSSRFYGYCQSKFWEGRCGRCVSSGHLIITLNFDVFPIPKKKLSTNFFLLSDVRNFVKHSIIKLEISSKMLQTFFWSQKSKKDKYYIRNFLGRWQKIWHSEKMLTNSWNQLTFFLRHQNFEKFP